MNEKDKKQLSQMYVQGYRTGYWIAMHFVKMQGNIELANEMQKYYNSHPMIDPIMEYKK